MYYKDELLSKGMPELVSIAEEFGIDTTTQNEEEKENLVYDILEKQATVEAAKNPMGTKQITYILSTAKKVRTSM